jgi:hypothetical protein
VPLKKPSAGKDIFNLDYQFFACRLPLQGSRIATAFDDVDPA